MNKNNPVHPDRGKSLPNGSYPALRFDIEEYRKYLQDNELTEAQQDDLRLSMWQIMVAFVDLGFGIHPVQQAMDKGAKPSKVDPLAMLSCKDSFLKVSSTSPATEAHLQPDAERKES